MEKAITITANTPKTLKNAFTFNYLNLENKGKNKNTTFEQTLFVYSFMLYSVKSNSMKKQLKAVSIFHKTYNLAVRNKPTVNFSSNQSLLRYKLMREENEEYLEAAQNKDIEEVADALGDMLYILCGTILDHGLQYKIEEVFDEIHQSNMSKLDRDGKPIYREDGKVLKGPNYFKPDIKKLLEK